MKLLSENKSVRFAIRGWGVGVELREGCVRAVGTSASGDSAAFASSNDK